MSSAERESRYEKRTNIQAGRFLRTKHPELFEIKPLPGGYRRRPENTRREEIASRSKSSEAKLPVPTSQRPRGKERVSIGDILETNVRCPATALPRDDRRNDTVRMCSIAVSTVMMLAQRDYDDITIEHVRHAQEYFGALKQPDGYPANVRQLARLLSHLKEGGQVVASFEDEENREESVAKETKDATATGENQQDHEAPTNADESEREALENTSYA